MSKIVLIILITFLSLNLHAILIEDIKMYSPKESIRDLTFEVESNEIKNLISQKLVAQDVEALKINYYWTKNNFDLNIEPESIPKETKEIIKQKLINKISLVINDDFDSFVKGYEYKQVEHGWQKWEDPTGLKDVSLIKIKANEDKIEIIQKKATGTINTIYSLEKPSWASGNFVINKFEKNIYEGLQNIKILGQISYQKAGGFWLPNMVKVNTTHILNQSQSDDFTRNIEVVYLFKNYQVNTAQALRWFTTR
jgi:hypothetical protein